MALLLEQEISFWKEIETLRPLFKFQKLCKINTQVLLNNSFIISFWKKEIHTS